MDKFNFDKIIKNLEKVKSDVPKRLGAATVNYFVGSFTKQGFDGKPWQPVKRQGKTGSRRNRSAILVQSGKLRREVSNSLRRANFNSIDIRVSLPYAKVHNEGLRAGRGRGFIMPKRQFIGQAKQLTVIQRSLLKSEIDKIWQG